MVPCGDMAKTEELNEVVAADLSSLMEAEEGTESVNVYEFGYHLTPTLSEDEAAKEASLFGNILKKHGAEVIGERTPREVRLAYAIEKKIGGARESFTTALFGWVAFEAPVSKISSIKEAFETHEQIIRFIITKTSRDQVAAVLADPSLDVGAPEPEVEVEAVIGADSEGVPEEVVAEKKEEAS